MYRLAQTQTRAKEDTGTDTDMPRSEKSPRHTTQTQTQTHNKDTHTSRKLAKCNQHSPLHLACRGRQPPHPASVVSSSPGPQQSSPRCQSGRTLPGQWRCWWRCACVSVCACAGACVLCVRAHVFSLGGNVSSHSTARRDHLEGLRVDDEDLPSRLGSCALDHLRG